MIKFSDILLVGSTVSVSGPMNLGTGQVRFLSFVITQGDRSVEGFLTDLTANSGDWNGVASGEVFEPGLVTATGAAIVVDELVQPKAVTTVMWTEIKEARLAPG